ncbi:MAG: hypothetical protein CMH54_04055 [Myxococcales bacterium]|nr:hypothetical protein [Myxococcales bacterium]
MCIFFGLACTDFRPRPDALSKDTSHIKTCNTVSDCDSLRGDCADPFCDTQGICAVTIPDDRCLVDGACFTKLAHPTNNSCLECRPGISQQTLTPVSCGPGEICDPDTGACLGDPDVQPSDICEEIACNDTLDCGPLGCCETSDDCSDLPGSCSTGTCLQDRCEESPLTGECRRILSSTSGCAKSAKPQTSSAWSTEQPETGNNDLWQFLTNPIRARFHQDNGQVGEEALLFGPNFFVSAQCSSEPIWIQVEHDGQITGAVPHLQVRQLGTLEWVDLGQLPPEEINQVVRPLTSYQVSDIPEFTQFQLALHSQLSVVPPGGHVTIYNVVVATGNPPAFNPESTNIVMPAFTASEHFIPVIDPDGTDTLFFEDLTPPQPDGTPQPYVFQPLVQNENGDVGVKLVFQDPIPGTYTVYLEVRDGASPDRLRDRIELNFHAGGEAFCGNAVIEGTEECDLGSPETPELCTSCVGTEITIDADDTATYDRPALSLLVGGQNSSAIVAWSAIDQNGDSDIWFRLIDPNTFLVHPIKAVTSSLDTHGHIAPAVLGITDTVFAVAWESTDGDHPILMRIYEEDGNPILGEAVFSPYTDTIVNGVHRKPRMARLDGSTIAIAWIDDWTDTPEDGQQSQVSANIVSIPGGLSAPQDSLVISHTPQAQITAVDVAGLSPSRVLFVWSELLPDESRIRFAVKDLANPAADIQPTLVATIPEGELGSPTAHSLPSGEFLVTYTHRSVDGSSTVVKRKLYNSLGAALGVSVGLAQVQGEVLGGPVTSRNGLSQVLLAWASNHPDGDGVDLWARREPWSGATLATNFFTDTGADIRLNLETSGDQLGPAIAGLGDGRYAIVWQTEGSDSVSTGIYLRFALPHAQNN